MSRAQVYAAIASDGLIKVGMSRQPDARLKTLNRRGPLKMILTTAEHERAREIERTAHQLLALLGKQVAGEWFKATPGEVRDAIAKALDIVEGRELPLAEGANLRRAGGRVELSSQRSDVPDANGQRVSRSGR